MSTTRPPTDSRARVRDKSHAGPQLDSNTLSLEYVEQLYACWLRDRGSVAPEWEPVFADWAEGDPFAGQPRLGSEIPVRSGYEEPSQQAASSGSSVPATLQHRVDQLIRAYRVRGHIVAQVDPLGSVNPEPPELDPAFYGFGPADMNQRFVCEGFGPSSSHTLSEIIAHLRNTYCRRIGVQFMHIDDLGTRRWLQERMEASENRVTLTREEQLRILTRLTDAVLFEEFLQKKFVGAKSFSLEGSESLIPLLDLAFESAAGHGVDRAVIGMAHRGRLNVLANVMGKSPRLIFREFEDLDSEALIGRGDVKYHLGFNNTWRTASGKQMQLYLCFNPSHLEYVNTVALGRVRAKQDYSQDAERGRGMCVLIHGDAAFAGEGIVQETLNLSELGGYRIGGTLHIIVNNQIGFTTSPHQGRSSVYASDLAKMLQIPIFHVNGEDPEAVAQVVRLALEFRRAYRRDVVIDMYAYRRRGHNEGDEPSFTQPLTYRALERRKTVREGYLAHLLELGQISPQEADQIAASRREFLERELSEARGGERKLSQDIGGHWKEFTGGPESSAPDVDTGVPLAELQRLGERLLTIPERFEPHPKIERLFAQRREMIANQRPLDWGMAEQLAMASLAAAGYRVRLTGQDCERGTFGHRHSVLHDFNTDLTVMPLAHVAERQAPVEIHNSPLSEAGVLGFEYGYSLDAPEALVIWEAQFGDFSNCAQVIIDQFIVSGEEKWGRLSGLVMLLPHGFEGMGPEHSSARLERFLSLASTENIQVAQPTTPAQLFHLLRRQVLRRWRKPLIVLTPKSLLRHPRAVSALGEFESGSFQRILPDNRRAADRPVSRVLLASGKVNLELERLREERELEDVAILRVELLYPLPDELLRQALAPYGEGVPVYWVQEEPANMGAWPFFRLRHGERLLERHPLRVVSRRAAASPATGSAASHRVEQEKLLREALGI